MSPILISFMSCVVPFSVKNWTKLEYEKFMSRVWTRPFWISHNDMYLQSDIEYFRRRKKQLPKTSVTSNLHQFFEKWSRRKILNSEIPNFLSNSNIKFLSAERSKGDQELCIWSMTSLRGKNVNLNTRNTCDFIMSTGEIWGVTEKTKVKRNVELLTICSQRNDGSRNVKRKKDIQMRNEFP